MALCAGVTPQTNKITLRRISGDDTGRIPSSTEPTMEWNISPSSFVPIKQSGRREYQLRRDNLGQIQIRYNQKYFECQQIFIHNPLYDVARGIYGAGTPRYEVSIVFRSWSQYDTTEYIHWIFPVEYGWGAAENDILNAWLTNNAKSQQFSTFADFLPDTIPYTQWVQCFLDSTGSQSKVNPVTFCYCTQALFIDRKIWPPDSIKRYDFYSGSPEFDRPDLPYEFLNETDKSWPSSTAATYGKYQIVNTQTTRYRVRQKSKKMAKCFSVSLERDLDAQGMIAVDPTTQQPLDPMEMRSLQGQVSPQSELSTGETQEAIDAAQKQKDTINSVILWVLVGILCFIFICGALYIVFLILSGKPLFGPTATSIAAAASAGTGAGTVTIQNPLYRGVDLQAAAVAASVAAQQLGSSAP